MKWQFRSARDIESLRQTWTELNAGAGNTPLLHPDFVEPALRHFGAGNEILAMLSVGSRIAAMAVLAPSGRTGFTTLQPPNAPLGMWLSEPGLDLPSAVHSLLRTLPGMPLLLGLTQQDPDILSRPADTPTITTLDYITTPRITVSGGFDQYWAARGKNLRQNIKRQHHKLERDGVAVRLEMLSSPAEMDCAVNDYARLEMAGWKGAANSAVSEGDAQSAFYHDMTSRFARRGEVRVYRYFLGDELAASDICLFVRGTLIILKTAYNEKFSQLSPAQLMRHTFFRDLWDREQCRVIEFYGPVKDWHLRWTDELRTMYHLNCYRWPVMARLHQSRVIKAIKAARRTEERGK
jgi:CelD/BcsL family acetyltransferase involved in cellulose biosynthesis